MEYPRIDPHVHFRDGQQAYKETIVHGMQVAEDQTVSVVFDMPNTDPPILTEPDIRHRLALVPPEQSDRYFLYIGATPCAAQLEEAVKCYDEIPEVIGIKLFAGKSVGPLAVINADEQRIVYQTLKDLGYTGTLAVHCEAEHCMPSSVWNPEFPRTHADARPPEAETWSVHEQLILAKAAGYPGNLHIAHVSVPESIDLLEEYNSVKTTCGVTPHHLLWDRSMLERPDGMIYKMNPPLRSADRVAGLRKYLAQGKIDWIETDHAPHPIGEKLHPPYMSGYPSLYLYKDLVENFLPTIGLQAAEIKELTYTNIYNTFKDKLD